MCSVDMNSASFNARVMCCACGGGDRSCINTDFGSRDKEGRSCRNYTSYDTCLQNATTASFNPFTMCCICNGGSNFIKIVTPPAPLIPPKAVVVGASLLFILIPLLVCLCCLPLLFVVIRMCCCRVRKRAPAVDDCFVVEKEDCYVIPENTVVDREVEDEMTRRRSREFASQQSRVVTPARIIRDDCSETTSVYATPCEIFGMGLTGTSLSKITLEPTKESSSTEPTLFDAFTCGGGTVSKGKHGAELLKSLAGEWVRHGHPSFSVMIRNGIAHVASIRSGFVEPCALKALDNGRVSFEVDDIVMVGQVMGDRLLFDNGDTWKRAGGRGGDSPFGGGSPGSGIGGFGGVFGGGGVTSPISGCYGGGSYAGSSAGSSYHQGGYISPRSPEGYAGRRDQLMLDAGMGHSHHSRDSGGGVGSFGQVGGTVLGRSGSGSPRSPHLTAARGGRSGSGGLDASGIHFHEAAVPSERFQTAPRSIRAQFP